jgi:hypothetical protein
VREADLLKCPTARITHLNICDSLPYYQPNTLAGAINNFFIAYPQKYENCSTLTHAPGRGVAQQESQCTYVVKKGQYSTNLLCVYLQTSFILAYLSKNTGF